MDDSQTSRVSDAAATRKRRSSILKTQRPARTPFSELEFNVATPTDTAKSRRVSFSRRTGVAEFATNEATTTWKNFYEEHNRTLETSGNEASKQIGHIGKRIFDQQFEVVEAECIDLHYPGNMNKSLTLNNFNQQLLSLDNTEELKLTGHHSIMNLTTFTNTDPNMFSEPAIPGGEVTDAIDINFSNVQQIGTDDLDDIENDLKQNFQGSFKRHDISEYIQIDLDVTQAALCSDDMSITDTVHSPDVHVPSVGNSDGNLKVVHCDDLDEIQRDLKIKYGHEISLSQSIKSLKGLDPKTKLVDGNYEVDKENIAINPYAPVRETENFAVNEEVDKVLVFDGKRLTLQADIAPLPPKPIENTQRKTIVLDFHDDLPNFVDVPDAHASGIIEVTQLKKNLVLDDMSITEPVLDTNKRSIIFNEDQGDITITQFVVPNIVSEDKRRTIHYDDSDGNISITQTLPTKIAEKRRTIVYDNDEGDMSITRALPTNFSITNALNEKRKTIVFTDGNMSITQAIPSNIIPEKTINRSMFMEDTQNISNIPSNKDQKQTTEKCRTIFFEDNDCNFTKAKAIPSKYLRETVAFEDDTGNNLVTRVPSVIIQDKVVAEENQIIEPQIEKVRRRTIVYDNVTGDLSITQSVSNHILKTNIEGHSSQKCLLIEVASNNATNIVNSDTYKRKTIVFDNDNADISMTQAVTSNQVLCAMRDENKDQDTKSEYNVNEVTNTGNSETNKRRTIVFDNDEGDISMTQAVSLNQVLCAMRNENKDQTTTSEGAFKGVTNTANSDTNKRKTIVFDNDEGDISMTQAVSLNQVLCAMRKENKDETTTSEGAIKGVTNTANSDTNKRKTIVFDNDEGDISMTQAVSLNQVLCAMRKENKDETTTSEGAIKGVTNTANSDTNKRKTIVFDNDEGDISMTQAVSLNQVLCAMRKENKDETTTSEGAIKGVTNTANSDTNKRKTIVFDNDEGDISMTQAVSLNQVLCAMRKENKDQTTTSEGAIKGVTNTANSDTNNRKTIVFDIDEANISTTQAVSLNQVLCAMTNENKDLITNTVNENYPESDVKKSFVLNDIYTDISINKTVPTNVIECFNLSINEIKKLASNSNNCVKRRTVVFEHDEGEISMTQVVNTEPIVQKPNVSNAKDGRNSPEKIVSEALHEALHNKNAKCHRTIVYEKEVNNLSVSVNQQPGIDDASSIRIKGNLQEHRNTASDNVTSAADSLAEILARIQNTDKYKQSGDKDTSEILNVSLVDTINEKRFDISSRNEIKKVIRNALSPEDRQESSSRKKLPSPTRVFEKNTNNEISNVIRENYNEAVVFQTAISLLTDKNSKSTNCEVFTENLSSSSKADNDIEVTQNKEVSSDMHQNKINNIEPQNKNTPPSMITNDKTDSEKMSVRSKSILNDLLNMSSSSTDESRQNSEDNKVLGENDSKEEGRFVITRDLKETKIQTDATDDTPQLIVQLPQPLEYKDNTMKEPIPLSQKIQNKLHNIKEGLVRSTTKKFDKIRTPILKGKSKADKKQPTPVTIKEHLALEDKSEGEPEAKQTFVRRQSIVLSRENLLNNLSLAGEALKTQMDFDDEDLEDSPEPENSPINNVRMSNEVVKTLQFDESSTETNLFEKLSSPLQKAAVGENSHVHNKTSVIPHFTNVSEGIKELMDDLVKPNSDVLPFDTSLAVKPTTKVSTHSTQIQANLVTSSQVALVGMSNESICNQNMGIVRSTDIINDAVNRSVIRALKNPIEPFNAEPPQLSEKEDVKKDFSITCPGNPMESPSRVLIFDHFNPLNNVLLSPKMLNEAHAYNPVLTEDGTVSENVSANLSLNDKKVESTENVTIQYNVSHTRSCMKQLGDSMFNWSKCTAPDLGSKLSIESKPPSIDRSTEAIKEVDLKTAEVNTLIAMKGNLELLEDHSSLTLVDDTLAQNTFDLTKSPGPTSSAMQVLYSYTNDDLDSELTSTEVRKSKKRAYNKHKQTTDRRSPNRSSIKKQEEVTPKPINKIKKLSHSPYTMKPKQSLHCSENVSVLSEKCKPANNVSIQNLVTENNEPILIQDSPVIIKEKVIDTLKRTKSGVSSLEAQTAFASDADISDIESSCTSSKNLRDDISQVNSTSSKASTMDLRQDILGSQKEDKSGVDVVSVIERLPFIGSECEWESRSRDMWSFRMLRGRVRLMMRLVPRDARRVAADTPVRNVNVEILQADSKNTLATLCVCFAADTMQWFVERGCRDASRVPTLVRQCAATARMAARWGRFMSDARHHLAYSLTPQGLITLKVANIPLRCVWEVTIQLRLANTHGSSAPWVEAGDVTVRRVMTCAPLRCNDDPARLLRDLPHDWSHAPRAIWKIFKYLKHMTREEDDELFMS